jgi:hypothetical protein
MFAHAGHLPLPATPRARHPSNGPSMQLNAGPCAPAVAGSGRCVAAVTPGNHWQTLSWPALLVMLPTREAGEAEVMAAGARARSDAGAVHD